MPFPILSLNEDFNPYELAAYPYLLKAKYSPVQFPRNIFIKKYTFPANVQGLLAQINTLNTFGNRTLFKNYCREHAVQ